MVFKRRDPLPFLRRLREILLPKRGWRRGIEYLGHRVRRLPDTPHRIALGFACGVFASFTPLFGLHLVLAVGLAWMVRGNVVASLIGTAAANPLTLPLIASISLWLGRRVLGHGATGRDPSRVVDAFGQAFAGLWESLKSLFGAGQSELAKLVPFFQDVFWPYLVGGLLPGLIAGVASYYLTRPLIAAYQLRRRARMLARAHERVAQAAPRSYNAGDTGSGST